MDKLEEYLDQVCQGIGGPRELRQHVRQELREHLRDAAAEYRAAGMSEEEALDRALADFGGPEVVRSELEATHGHRLLPVVIEKAMQWKERTMKAKWLWTTWAYLSTAGVLVVEVLFFALAKSALVPKLKKLQSDGWFDLDRGDEQQTMAWFASFLRGLDWAADNFTWIVLLLAVAWGMFEWRVRSENKAFMRLSALGTAALVLALAAAITTLALVIPFLLGFPAVTKLTGPRVTEQMTSLDTSIATLEQALAKKDWASMPDPAARAFGAVDTLTELAPTLRSLVSREKWTDLADVRAQLASMKTALQDAQTAIREKDDGKMGAALKTFHDAFDPLKKAAMKPEK